MAKSEEELKSLLMRVKEENEKAGLKLNFQKTKIMATGPITSWQIEGVKVEAVTDFIFLASKITADSEGSHKINRHVLLGKKHMTDLDSVFKKQRHHFADNFPLVKAMVFPVVMYRCVSWVIMTVEHQRINAFKLWC